MSDGKTILPILMKTSYLKIKEDLDVIERSDSSIKYLSGYIMGFFHT